MFGFKRADNDVSQNEAQLIVARLNARVQPMERGDFFEDPLSESLEEAGLGEVTGGGTQLAAEPAGIEFCDVEISVPNHSADVVEFVMARLDELGAPKGSRLILEPTGQEILFGSTEGLGLFLNGTDLPDEVYATSDVNHVISECDRLMGERGEFRGYWQGSRETALYFYGASFERMHKAVAAFVADYPLCRKCRIERVA